MPSAVCSLSQPPRLPARGAAVIVAAMHLALAIALLQMQPVQAPLRQAVLAAAPLMVSLWMPPAAAPPLPAAAASPTASPTARLQLPPTPLPSPPLAPVPAIDIALPPSSARTSGLGAPAPAAAPTAAPTTPAPTAAAVAAAVTATPVPPSTFTPTAPPPPPAPARKQVTAAAMGYLVPPPAEVPLASRRAGESGVVWLRVVVDVNGLPAQVQVQRSSGYPRLDAQAVAAMRQARFRPHTESGQTLEVEVLAPIEYPSE